MNFCTASKNLFLLKEAENLIIMLGLKLFSDLEITRSKAFHLLETFVSFFEKLTILGVNDKTIREAKNNIASSEHVIMAEFEKREFFFIQEPSLLAKKTL